MATKSENTDIANLKTDVALIKRDIQYVVKQIDSFQFTPLVDFNKLEMRVKAIEEYNTSNVIGNFLSNDLGKKILTAVSAAIVIGAVYILAKGGTL